MGTLSGTGGSGTSGTSGTSGNKTPAAYKRNSEREASSTDTCGGMGWLIIVMVVVVMVIISMVIVLYYYNMKIRVLPLDGDSLMRQNRFAASQRSGFQPESGYSPVLSAPSNYSPVLGAY